MLLIGLAVVCAISLAIAFQLNVVNKSLRNQYTIKEQEFNQEKSSLSKQLSTIVEAKKRLDIELGDLKGKFDSLVSDKDALQNKFDLVTKERATLVEKMQELADARKKLEQEIVSLKSSTSNMSAADATIAAMKASSGDDAYWAGLLKEKASLEIQVNSLKTQLDELRLKTEQAMEAGRKLDLQLRTVTEAKNDLERRFIYNEKLAETLSGDLVREKRDKKSLLDQLEGMRRENFDLKTKMLALGDRKSTLETKLVDLQQEREILAKRLSELDSILQERVDQIIQVKDDLKAARIEAKQVSTKDSRVVQLQPIVVKAGNEGSGSKGVPVGGQVLAINDENNFVIVDVGEDDGVKSGQTLSVYRNNQRIGTLEVIQTRKEISAADIKNVNSGSVIKIGDMVN